MKRKYSDCYYCGGVVSERIIPREIRWHGKLYIIEDVPVCVCGQCGEKVIVPDVASDIDSILRNRKEPEKTIQVPVFSLY